MNSKELLTIISSIVTLPFTILAIYFGSSFEIRLVGIAVLTLIVISIFILAKYIFPLQPSQEPNQPVPTKNIIKIMIVFWVMWGLVESACYVGNRNIWPTKIDRLAFANVLDKNIPYDNPYPYIYGNRIPKDLEASFIEKHSLLQDFYKLADEKDQQNLKWCDTILPDCLVHKDHLFNSQLDGLYNILYPKDQKIKYSSEYIKDFFQDLWLLRM